MNTIHQVHDTAMMVTTVNHDFIHGMLDKLMTMDVEQWMQEARRALDGRTDIDTLIIEVSNSQLLAWEKRHGEDPATARLKATKWAQLFDHGVNVSTATYHKRLPKTIASVAHQYNGIEGLYTYFIFNYYDTETKGRVILQAARDLRDYFATAAAQAIEAIGNREVDNANLRIPIVANEAFMVVLEQALHHHNQRVCFVYPQKKKVNYTLAHQDGGFGTGSPLTILVTLSHA